MGTLVCCAHNWVIQFSHLLHSKKTSVWCTRLNMMSVVHPSFASCCGQVFTFVVVYRVSTSCVLLFLWNYLVGCAWGLLCVKSVGLLIAQNSLKWKVFLHCLIQTVTLTYYRIVGNVRGRKLSRIWRFCGYFFVKFWYVVFWRGMSEQSMEVFSAKIIFHQFAKVFCLESFPLYGN